MKKQLPLTTEQNARLFELTKSALQGILANPKLTPALPHTKDDWEALTNDAVSIARSTYQKFHLIYEFDGKDIPHIG
jgi:hypothetical protein